MFGAVSATIQKLGGTPVAKPTFDFMGDGIFVAHSVNFDYGFIASEFEKVGRRFRFPKVCTCAGMRRSYPGLASAVAKARKSSVSRREASHVLPQCGYFSKMRKRGA